MNYYGFTVTATLYYGGYNIIDLILFIHLALSMIAYLISRKFQYFIFVPYQR